MYISRPPISVSSDPQKSPKTRLNGLSPEAATTLGIKDRDDSLRHPVTKKFTSRFQNDQTADDYSDTGETRVTQDKGSLPGNKD